MATYSGNLVRTWSNAQESANFHPDPRHGIRNTPEEYPTTDQVYADTGAEYAGTDFPSDVMVGGGSVLSTPTRSHHGRGGRRMVYTDDQHRASLADRHGEDGQRSYVRRVYTLPGMQDARTVRSDTYRQSPDIYAHANNTGAVGVMRNVDGNPQNNPEGVRRGWERGGPHTDAQRRLGRRRYVYDPQPLTQRNVYVPIDQPAVQGAGPDIVSLKFWKQGGTLTNVNVKRPALYREPPAVDAGALAVDQAATSAVIGGGVVG